MMSRNCSRSTCRPRTTRQSVRGGGQDQPDRSPQPGPKCCRHVHRERREAGTMAIQHRFDGLAHDRLDSAIERHRPYYHRPARIDRRSERERQNGRHRCTRYRARSAAASRVPPQHRRRHTDEEQASADDRTEARVDGELCQEISNCSTALEHRYAAQDRADGLIGIRAISCGGSNN
jgi:hypothetical protein